MMLYICIYIHIYIYYIHTYIYILYIHFFFLQRKAAIATKTGPLKLRTMLLFAPDLIE